MGVAPTERLNLRKQMAAAAGKKESVSLSLFVEVNDLEVEEELSTMASQAWAVGVWIGKSPAEQKAAWREQIFEVQKWKQVRGLAGAEMCETRDLGVKWPQWHTLLFDGQGRVDMRFICPRDVKKMYLKQFRTTCLKKWASRHERGEIEHRSTA